VLGVLPAGVQKLVAAKVGYRFLAAPKYFCNDCSESVAMTPTRSLARIAEHQVRTREEPALHEFGRILAPGAKQA
jgi:hypothetical protein